MTAVALTVNGAEVELDVDARETLLDVVRDRLGLTGTHAGCEQGSCGACSVLLDGEVARACLVLGVQAAGHEVTTIEAVGTPDHLHPVQQALRDHHGLQCGFCTPGIVLTAIDLLARVPAPDAAEVRDAVAGNLCRCTGYTGLVAAIVAAGAARPGAPFPSGSDHTAPDHTAPDGTAPDGTAPDGTAPDGTAPDGTAPDGTAPDGAAPDGTAPDGTAPDGTAPDGTAPDGAAPDGRR
jgi:carbon-monoxide dehydrogenase small subunit